MNLTGIIAEKMMLNIDFLAMLITGALAGAATLLPIAYLLDSALCTWWPWYEKKMYGKFSKAEIFTEEECMKVMTFLGAVMVIVPIVVVIAYLSITGMSISELWVHQMITKWR